jgi:hypothetical protein
LKAAWEWAIAQEGKGSGNAPNNTGREIFKEPFTKELERYTPNSELGAYNANPLIEKTFQLFNRLGGGNEYTPAGTKIDDKGNVSYSGAKRYIFDWNPSKAEHLLEYYFGGRGRFVNDIYKTVRDGISQEREIQTYNIPVFKRLYMTPYRGNVWNDYKEIRLAIDDYKYYKKQSKGAMDIETMQKLYGNGSMQAIETMYETVDKIVKKQTEAARMVENPDDRKAIYESREDIMRNFIKSVRELENNDK